MRHQWITAIAVLMAAELAWAQGEIAVNLPRTDGKERILTGNRVDILNYADQFIDRGNYPYAVRCYETLLAYDASDVRARVLLGRLYQFRIGDYARALAAYNKAEQFIPETQREQKAYVLRLSADAYRELAEKKGSLVYYAQAISEYERVLRYAPEDSEAWYLLGVASLNGSDYERAILAFEHVIENDPKSPWAKESRDALTVARKEKRSR